MFLAFFSFIPEISSDIERIITDVAPMTSFFVVLYYGLFVKRPSVYILCTQMKSELVANFFVQLLAALVIRNIAG